MKMQRFNFLDKQQRVDAYLDGGQATLAPHDLPYGTGPRAVSKSSAGKVNALREVESAVEGRWSVRQGCGRRC